MRSETPDDMARARGDIGDTRLPRLAFSYHPRSFPALAIAEAARGLCELVWLVDPDDERMGPTVRLLARLGTVQPVGRMKARDAARALESERLDGILALSDELLVWTADLADALGLPFLSTDSARALTDKFEQRAAFAAAGLPAPGSRVLTSGFGAADWSRLAAEFRFPAVLKPRRGEGSRNTFAVGSVDEVRDAVAEGGAREWVLEEYIPDADAPLCGDGFANYVSVESFVQDGRPTALAVTGRTPPAHPFRETGFFMPAALDANTREAVVDAALGAVAALGITVGCQHTEVKLTPRGPVVIEVNGRIGGGMPELLSLTTGIDLLGVALRLALGVDVDPGQVAFNGLAYLLYVQAPDGLRRVTAVTGLEALAEAAGVREITLNRAPGQEVDWRDGNHGYVYSVLGTAAGPDGLRVAMARTSELVRIDGE